MLNIVLIGDEKFSLKDIEQVRHIGAQRSYYSEDFLEYTVEFEEPSYIKASGYPKGIRLAKGFDYLSYAFCTYEDESVKLDFPKEQIAHIPFKATVFVLVSFKYIQTMKRVLRQLDFPQNLYVDDDFGSILPLQEFNKLDWNPDKGNILPT